MERELTIEEREALSAWLDGELSTEQAARVAELVESDGSWAAEARQLRALDRALDAWQAPTPPDGLAKRVAAAVRSRRWLVRFGRRLSAAAAAAAVVLLAITLLHDGSGDDTGRTATASPTVPEEFVVGALDVFAEDAPATVDPSDWPERIQNILGTPSLVEAFDQGQEQWAKVEARQRQRWEILTDEQRRDATQTAMGFLELTPEQQQARVEQLQKAYAGPARPEVRWLEVVLESFTADEREALRKMHPAERARKFLEKRDRLLRAGELRLH